MTGSLQIKNGTFYAILNFRDHNNKRVQKWFNLHMPVRGNRRKAEEALQELINTYQGFSNIEPINTLLSLHRSAGWRLTAPILPLQPMTNIAIYYASTSSPISTPEKSLSAS